MEHDKDILLEIKDYTVEFHTETGVKQAINHLNLEIHKGESLGLVGEAGAGMGRIWVNCLKEHCGKFVGQRSQ